MKVNKKVTILVVAIVAAVAILSSQSSMLIAGAQISKLEDILKLNPNAPQTRAEVQTCDRQSSTTD
jgi:hypothetical protein